MTKSAQKNFLLSHSRAGDLLLAFVLSFSLFCTQWLGLDHTIAHAGTYHHVAVGDASVPDPISASAPAAEPAHKGEATHSCLLFDAATLGAVLKTPHYCDPEFARQVQHYADTQPASWYAPFSDHFDSRAPPASN